MSDNQLSGTELSEAVAVRVFEEPQPPALASEACPLILDRVEPSPKGAWLHVHRFDHGDACEWQPRPFSESIEAAMQVVEKLRRDRWIPSLVVVGDKWFAELFRAGSTPQLDARAHGESQSLAEAICRCALKAVESK